jgi:alanyl-tRNA synthetase
MKMRSSHELRELYLKYFEENTHRRVASHSLIPPADPSLLFVNAGMVQFKDVFVGVRKVDYRRATSSQKCLRVSGKHNDLENVGRTARHHTFFEMLGNFSFGDYFKKDAIRFAYEFLVDRVGLDAGKMYYTVFGGDAADGIGADEEAAGLWMTTAGVGPERIYRFGKKDNFWAMGETGPCGPCSEIIYDRGPGPWACGKDSCGPGCDCDRYMEIWNLVFMQFERKVAGGALAPLPAPSIDTGMGLERLASVVQGKATNYDTDLFMPVIERTCGVFTQVTGRPVAYGADPETDVALRVIADHARAAAFLVSDGVYPDNEGRGYITRLLVRRAVRFGRKMGFDKPFFFSACDRVVDIMSGAYPELLAKRALIEKVISVEEQGFLETFEEGRRALDAEMDRLAGQGLKVVDGQFLFWLHDERGFQPDLTELIAGERGFAVDRAGYERLMEEKRQASGRKDGGQAGASASAIGDLAARVGPTRFVGYDAEKAEARIVALLKGGVECPELTAGDEGQAVLDVSPFYGEAGGQVGDSGALAWKEGGAEVTTTAKAPGDMHLHALKVTSGRLRVGDRVDAAVDHSRRSAIRAHHSGTHLLHWALNEVLGSHIKQEGSLVREDLLRFDFRHFSPLTREEIERIEALVAGRVLDDSEVETRQLAMAEAVASGAKAFFDEKYGETVRVVSMGDGVSQELCGGTHVRRTGAIGCLKVTKQEAVSSGVRRIYAVCHMAAVGRMQERERRLEEAAQLLHCATEDVDNRVQKLIDTSNKLEKDLKDVSLKLIKSSSSDASFKVFGEGDRKGGYALLEGGDDAAVRGMADMLRDKVGSGVVLVGSRNADKLLFVVAGTRDRTGDFHCGKATTELAKLCGGRGGGKPDFGQAGGGNPDQWESVVSWFRELVTGR